MEHFYGLIRDIKFIVIIICIPVYLYLKYKKPQALSKISIPYKKVFGIIVVISLLSTGLIVFLAVRKFRFKENFYLFLDLIIILYSAYIFGYVIYKLVSLQNKNGKC